MRSVYDDEPPAAGPEAFEERSASAHQAQAALLLWTGAAVDGREPDVDVTPEFPVPPAAPLARGPRRLSVRRAAAALDVDTASYASGAVGEIPPAESVRLTRAMFDRPAVTTAAALIESGLHAPHRLVRTAAAVAALDTTGPREEVVAQLVEAAEDTDPDIRDLGRIGLARAVPQHVELGRYVRGRTRIRRRSRPSHTAVLSHGTFAANGRWWRPGGSFYAYLDGLQPPLHLHSSSFRWSGAYSHAQRDLAADDLRDWVVAENLDEPDWFAHSHGATVAALATQKGQRFSRLVNLAFPVHGDWLPDPAQVQRIIDVRVRWDLVILADRGGQSLPPGMLTQPHVEMVRHGWFSHSAPREQGFWEKHDIPAHL